MSNFHLIWTIVLMVIFVGIFLWAWSSKRSTDFEEAARLPFDDEDEPGDLKRSAGRRDVNHG